MLRKLKVAAIVLVAVLLNQVAGYVVHAAVPDAFLASGSTRYAVAYAADEITNSSNTYADIPGMRASISIPEGKRGDVLLLFCAESWTDGATRVAPWIAGAYGTPSSTQIRISPPGGFAESRCFNFHRLNVHAGTKIVKMQWREAGGGTSSLGVRHMIVIVNLHN